MVIKKIKIPDNPIISKVVLSSCENEKKRLFKAMEHSFKHPSENGRTPILDRAEIL